MLGVEFDLLDSSKGILRINNKPQRVDSLLEFLDEMLEKRKHPPADLPTFLGRLQFADMQISGRLGKMARHDLRSRRPRESFPEDDPYEMPISQG